MSEKMTEQDIDAGGKKFGKFFKILFGALVVFGLLAVFSGPSEDDSNNNTTQYEG